MLLNSLSWGGEEGTTVSSGENLANDYRNEASNKKQHPAPKLSGKVSPKASNLERPWQALQLYTRERSTLKAARRELEWTSQQAPASPAALGISAPGLALALFLLPPVGTSSSPQLAAAPCWNPNFLGLEN